MTSGIRVLIFQILIGLCQIRNDCVTTQQQDNRMARGGRSGGHHGSHGHHHGFGHGHHHHFSSSASRNHGPSFEVLMDTLHNTQIPATLVNGVYTFQGSEMAFRAQAENTAQPTQINMMMPMMMPMMSAPVAMTQIQMVPPEMTAMPAVPPVAPEVNMSLPVQQANITLVGNKTKSSNPCCLLMTFMFACLIFPIFFMCCGWWKKIVSPVYELSAQAYQSIGSFIRANPTVNNLNLTVIDNAFSAGKGRLLAEALGGSRITGLTFVNGAIAFNGDQNEFDDFAANVQPIKALSMTSSITWDSVIV